MTWKIRWNDYLDAQRQGCWFLALLITLPNTQLAWWLNALISLIFVIFLPVPMLAWCEWKCRRRARQTGRFVVDGRRIYRPDGTVEFI